LKNGDASEKANFNTSLSNEKTNNLVAEKRFKKHDPKEQRRLLYSYDNAKIR